MSIPYISAGTVRKVLNMSELIPLVEKAMVNYSLSCGSDGASISGGVVQPLRSIIPIKDKDAVLITMPVYSSVDGVLATKLVSLFPHNKETPTHQGTIVLMSAENGSVLCFMDAEVITEMRTAAASAVATCHLAAPSSSSSPLKLGIIGSGVQARSHVRALRQVRLFSEIRVWSRNKERLRDFVDEFRSGDKEGANGVVSGAESAAEAVADADVIVTATLSKEPVLFKQFVKPGAHINAVGAPFPDQCELDGELVRSSSIYADSRIGALKEAGDVIMNGAQDRVVAEIGEFVAGKEKSEIGKATVHCSCETTTIFKNLGMAIQDAVAAKLVYEKLVKGTGNLDVGSLQVGMGDHGLLHDR